MSTEDEHGADDADIDGDADLFEDDDEVVEVQQQDRRLRDTGRPPSGPRVIDLVNVPNLLCRNCKHELDGESCSCCGALVSVCKPYAA